MPKAVLRRMGLAVSTRNYENAIELGREGFGVKRSSVSRAFIEGATKALEELRSRRFEGVRFAALLIDGKEFAGEQVVVALGVKESGEKVILGLIQGATENSTVVGDLFKDLEERGLSKEHRVLAIVDGSTALSKALKKFFGDKVFIQRCQVHKMRNVMSYLSEEHSMSIRSKLQEAYRQNHEDQVRQQLAKVRRELELMNPDAARSLDEGFEETLTVYKLGVTGELRRSFSSTNIIESTFSVVEGYCSNVKRWRAGTMRLRWCASGLQHAENKFKRIKGYRAISDLVSALDKYGQFDELKKAA
jgi:transposase-like protein